ncbi:MAG: UDP-N-acetylglucosamine 2-epimerase [Anaerolineae bacterium]|nr:UDP-N-acetylglucosamine 2-epimerase [Anaerolineae bacterium]
MIHVFVGTKAQFIKMAPIMMELNKREILYNLIDAGQHGGLTGELMEQFALGEPNVFLRSEKTTIKTMWQAIKWTAKSLLQLIVKPKAISNQVFQGKKGVCLIHGDTLTTLISLLYAKRCGIKVAHVEAGLRSYRLFDPFPEEIIRLLAMRFSDILFAPSEWAYQNLKKMGYEAKTIDAGGNTIIDTVRYALEKVNGRSQTSQPYIIVTTHRVETIYSKSRLQFIIEFLEKVADQRQVRFVLHHPTENQLRRFGLFGRLAHNPQIELSPLQPYIKFVGLLANADFIVTDGGSIQEESYILNKPCLIMRTTTERMEGLGENAFLADFSHERIDQFLNQLPSFNRVELPDSIKPSATIVDHITEWA